MIKDGAGESNKKIISFLMIGQSNMAGRGEFSDVEPIKNERCHMLRMGRWQPMSEPINVDRDVLNIRFHSGIGLAASFADEVSRYMDSDVGLIPCADGGTRICQWQPGEVLFDHAVMMTRLALRTSELGGIIWHQGESDCAGFDADKYRARFLNTMTVLRKELGAEKLPIIIGELSESLNEKYKCGDNLENMNSLLHSLAKELPLCGIASAKGLALKDDELHFNSVSCRELGRRYFEEYKALVKK